MTKHMSFILDGATKHAVEQSLKEPATDLQCPELLTIPFHVTLDKRVPPAFTNASGNLAPGLPYYSNERSS
jgi:hypothetical protein